MVEMMKSSRNVSTRSLYDVIGRPKAVGLVALQEAEKHGSKFRKQLNLMKQLDECDPQYIRCIKSNHEKRGGIFASKMCLEQLRYSGVFEAVEIRKTGYPFRWYHSEFAARFRCITLNSGRHGLVSSLESGANDFPGICKEIIGEKFAGKHGVNEAQVGKSRVLYRAKYHKLRETSNPVLPR